MELRQELSLKLLPLSLLIQKLDLLTLPLLDLQQTIEQELEQNPFLEMEEGEEKTNSEQQEASSPDEQSGTSTNSTESESDKLGEENMESKLYPPSSADYRDEDEEEREIPLPAPPPTFKETLISQLNLSFNDPKLIRIGEYIIYELDENGFLPMSLKEIAEALQEDESIVKNVLSEIMSDIILKQSLQADEEVVKDVLSQLQQIAPDVGVCTLQACLLIQLNSQPVPDYVIQLVSKCFNELMNQDYPKIMKTLKISEPKLQEALKLIKSCNPKPINGNSGEVRHILPDVVIEKKTLSQFEGQAGSTEGNDRQAGEWAVYPTTEWLPNLRLTKEYHKLIKVAASTGDPATNEYLKKKLAAAKLLLEGIEKRRTTLRDITKYIAKNIVDFLEHKTDSFQFITLEEVGKAIGRDVSTISRAVKDKWVETPYGLVEFKHFFSKGRIKEYLGVQKRIKELVENEDKAHPLKDGEILKILKQEGNNLARTTIVKYRTELGIPPAYDRRACERKACLPSRQGGNLNGNTKDIRPKAHRNKVV